MEELLKYIPKEYRCDVYEIYEGTKEYNDITKRWNTTIIVEWKDGQVNEYQNKTYMREKLKCVGRD